MILETGTVVAIEPDGLWVETIQKSACEVCVAEKGCGHKFLSKLAGKTASIRVLRNQAAQSNVAVGQSVTIGIPEDVIVLASLLVYLMPIVLAVVAAAIVGGSDARSAAAAAGGLAIGAALVYLHSARSRNDKRMHPILIEPNSSLNNALNNDPKVVQVR